MFRLPGKGFPRRGGSPEGLACDGLTMTEIPLLATVALTVDLPENGLTRGQIGTVVELLGAENDPALLVEFSDDQGQTLALAALKPDQLLALHRQVVAA